MKLGVEVKNGQQSSNPELCFWSDPPNHPNHPTPYPPNLPQNTNFANFGPICMKLGVEVKKGQQSSKPVLFFDPIALATLVKNYLQSWFDTDVVPDFCPRRNLQFRGGL